MDRKTIRLKADKGKGYLYVAAKKLPKASVGEFQKVAEGKYRLCPWCKSCGAAAGSGADRGACRRYIIENHHVYLHGLFVLILNV